MHWLNNSNSAGSGVLLWVVTQSSQFSIWGDQERQVLYMYCTCTVYIYSFPLLLLSLSFSLIQEFKKWIEWVTSSATTYSNKPTRQSRSASINRHPTPSSTERCSPSRPLTPAHTRPPGSSCPMMTRTVSIWLEGESITMGTVRALISLKKTRTGRALHHRFRFSKGP